MIVYPAGADMYVPFKAIDSSDRATPVTGLTNANVALYYGVAGSATTWTKLTGPGSLVVVEMNTGSEQTGDYCVKIPASGAIAGIVMYAVHDTAAGGTMLPYSSAVNVVSASNPYTVQQNTKNVVDNHTTQLQAIVADTASIQNWQQGNMAVVGNQLIIYSAENPATELKRFDLKDSDGDPTSVEPFSRTAT